MILPAIVLGGLLYSVIDDYNKPDKPPKSPDEKLADAIKDYLTEKSQSDKK